MKNPEEIRKVINELKDELKGYHDTNPRLVMELCDVGIELLDELDDIVFDLEEALDDLRAIDRSNFKREWIDEE